ncbi:MAG: PLP-dependent aminotransferase family protein [Spirochaetia bacterium]|jgi:DNA-binding transcriptional MocR family regulator
MVIDLDRNAATPLYLQLKTGIADLIGNGQLLPGSRLPSTRELSISLGVNRNTVISAYQELEVEGLVSSHVGRGTAVSEHLPMRAAVSPVASEGLRLEPLLSTSWRNSHQRLPPGLEQLLETEEEPHTISFASHSPDIALFPTEEFASCLQSAMRTYGADLLTTGSPRGFPPLLAYLPQFLARRGIRCTEQEIMIVNGIQQGLSLVARLFVDPGDTVIMENLTYPGALGAFRSLQATCVGIPLDGDGMRIDVVESVLRRRRAKLVYTMPTYHNPTGTVLPPDRRDRLGDLAREHELVVVEDDYVHELAFDGREVLPLKARDTAGGMIYMGSFSEILCPGIRLSWIVASPAIIDRLLTIKQFADLYTNRILQGALLEFIQKGLLERHLKRKVAVSRARCAVMLEEMKTRFPDEVSWQKPRGGIFLWADLPRGLDALALLVKTRRQGVVFAPDRVFSVEEWERGGMRLGFAGVEEEKIRKGIRILADALKETLAGAGP